MNIAIRFVNMPKPGGKFGNLKLTDGTMIMCPPELLPMFRAGMQCEIQTKQQEWGPGNVVNIATSGPLPPLGGQQGNAGYQGANLNQGAQRANTGFVPRVVQGGGLPPKSPEQERMIYITGIVGRAMGSGKFAASEIPILTQAAAAAWDQLTKPRPVEPANKPMPDEPPMPAPSDYPGAG